MSVRDRDDDSARIGLLQERLTSRASREKRAWWSRYLKGVISFRGVGIPDIREAVAAWRLETGLDGVPGPGELRIAVALLEQPLAEDKLAGILLLQDHVAARVSWEEAFAAYERVFARELIFDWNTCDWFCVRVLGPTLVREGRPVARRLGTWSRADYLWQARAGLVPFVKVVSDPAHRTEIARISRRLVRREERFAKTAVGWVLREAWPHDPEFVEGFVLREAAHFSRESARNALKHVPAERRERLLAALT